MVNWIYWSDMNARLYQSVFWFYAIVIICANSVCRINRNKKAGQITLLEENYIFICFEEKQTEKDFFVQLILFLGKFHIYNKFHTFLTNWNNTRILSMDWTAKKLSKLHLLWTNIKYDDFIHLLFHHLVCLGILIHFGLINSDYFCLYYSIYIVYKACCVVWCILQYTIYFCLICVLKFILKNRK